MNAARLQNKDWYTAFCSSVLFPLQERLKGHDTVAVRQRMEETQWWPRDKLEALQLERLRKLLAHAAENVPYYRELFSSIGFIPEKLGSLRDLERLPYLTKSIIQTDPDRFKASNAGPLAKSNTGGSSGEPLQFFLGKERVCHDVAAKWRATRWWGVDIGDPEVVVWGSPVELGAQDTARAWRDKVFRTQLLPAFAMSQLKLDRFIDSIRNARPRMLFGYPSALTHVARHAEGRGLRMDNLGIKVAFVTAERLYDDQRETLQRVFGCRVANGYGGRDAGFIAHECPYGGMHITAEDGIVEIVDSAGQVLPPGESGEIVVTHLASKHFPFIRYRTGDVAALDDKPCACNRGLPLLKDIQGRTTDFVVARDGTVMHGLALIYVVRDLRGIKQFKIVQESLNHTRVMLVVDDQFRPETIDQVKSGIEDRLGGGVNVSVELTASIDPESSGKHRYVISKVATA